MRDVLTSLRRNTRLVLVAEQAEVAALPWEYLRLPETLGSLLLATRYNLVRGIAEGQRQESFALDGGLKIVAVPVSAVNERKPLNTEGEWKNLRETVKACGKVVTLQRVRPPTLKAMRSTVNGEGTKIVQFMGHSNEGVLVFENELGRAIVVNSAQFVNALDEQTLLVVLNSCYSAMTSGTTGNADNIGEVSPFANIARLVVHEGVPYALGMQFSLPDDDAPTITKSLYDYLLNGRGIEEAVRLMRADIEDNTKWLAGVPVLYTSLREPAPALKLVTGQPTLIPDPVRLTQTLDLSALSTPPHFFGRADDISETLEALQDTSQRGFVVLHGLGGIGKTTLARIVATRISWYYQDRVLAYSFETFARFAFEGDTTHTTVDTQFAARFYNRLATFYGLDPAQYPETRDLQNAIVQQRTHIRSLLILDNIETLVYTQNQKDDNALQLASFIRDLQHEGDILLTTREMPHSDWGERKDIRLLGLNDEAGAELFLASIANDRKDAAPKKDRKELSKSVYGHPLCIRLLAGRFSEDKAGDLATFRKNLPGELGRSRQATPTSTDDSTRQETFDNCMEYSVRRLTPELENVLHTLGIFRAPFLSEFAQHVLNEEESITAKHLQDLVRLGLLERTSSGFYELHPMLRLHIKANIEALDAEKRQRYGEVYENLARLAYDPGEDSYDNSATTRSLLRQSLPDCEAALADDDIDLATRSMIAYSLAKPYERMGQVKHALSLYEASLKASQELGDVRGIAVTQHAMADVLVQQGQVGKAMELYEASLKVYEELGDVRSVAVTQGAMADVLVQQGQVGKAMELYEASLKAKQELGDVRGIAVTRTNLGSVLWQQGEYVKALTMVWQAYKSLPEQDFLPDSQAIQGILISFKKNLSDEEQAFDVLWQQATFEPQPMWLKEAQVGSSGSNGDAALTEEEVAEIVQAIIAFVNAENWGATQQVVEAQQEILFRPETEFVFEQFIEQAKASGEQRAVELLEIHLAILRECKVDGIAATFERVKGMGGGGGMM